MQSSFRTEAEKGGLPPEKNDGKLTAFVLEREVDVSGSRAAQVGYFAFDPAVGIGSLDLAAYFRNEGTDSPDTP
jgi:hypothetical protein